MTARVDKQWKDKGLTTYSTESILGTLGHYGLTIDEASFKASATSRFPLDLAMDWKPKWKGTGQFAPLRREVVIQPALIGEGRALNVQIRDDRDAEKRREEEVGDASFHGEVYLNGRMVQYPTTRRLALSLR